MAKNLLIVDDEPPTREILCLFFRRKGFEVSAAETGSAGMAMIRANDYDLVILDVDLGDANGVDLLPAIKAQKPTMPVIIFTGLSCDDQLIGRAMQYGASGFISKTQPLDFMLQEVQKNL